VPKSAIVRIRRSSYALLCAFFLTGSTSLVLEVVWTRLLLLSLGTTPVAMGIVLAALDRHPPALSDIVTDYGTRATLELELAASLFTAGREVEALLYCERALADEPSSDGLKLLGQIAERGGDRRRARHAWRLALAADPDPGQRALARPAWGSGRSPV